MIYTIIFTILQIIKPFITPENIKSLLSLLTFNHPLLTLTQSSLKEIIINLIASYIFLKLISPKYHPKHNIRPKLKHQK
jgi:hypothetical protein